MAYFGFHLYYKSTGFSGTFEVNTESMTPSWTKLFGNATDQFSLDDQNVILDQICKNTRIDRTGCHGNGKRWIGTSSLAQGNTALLRLPVSFYSRELFLPNINDSI